MYISEDIKYVGVNDHKIDLFEGQYDVPNGMSYNSYVIVDEKIAVMDTVDSHFSKIWMNNLSRELGDKNPDYLVVQHMEPDHSGAIMDFMNVYPQVQIVASAKAFVMIKQFFRTDYTNQQIIVAEDTTLDLGKHKLSFIAAPMVHWPEVIVTYDETDKVLFSADGFGKFGALDVEENWADEARRYYIGIVGKYGMQVQTLLKKVSVLDIHIIAPLHGPILADEQLGQALALYNIWSGYIAEKEGILIAYTSIYGHTKEAAEYLYQELNNQGKEVAIVDLARTDLSKCVADAFAYKKIVLASPTYNGEVFPYMRNFIEHLTERNYKNREVAFIENGSWAPTAANVMKKMLEKCKGLTLLEPVVSIKGTYTEENKISLKEIAEKL